MTPSLDPDLHNELLRFILCTKEPTSGDYWVTLYYQGKLLSLLNFLEVNTIVAISRLTSIAIFLVASTFIIKTVSKKNTLIYFSILSLFFLGMRSNVFLDYVLTHSLWYYSLNYLFLAVLFYQIPKLAEQSKYYLVFFCFIYILSLLNKVSIFLPLFLYTLFFYLGDKKSLVKILLIQIAIFFVVFYFIIRQYAGTIFNRPALDQYVFPRSSFFRGSYNFQDISNFFLTGTNSFFYEIHVNVLILVFLSFIVFFFRSSLKQKSVVLTFFSLLICYLSLSVLGKFLFGSVRYNFDAVCLILLIILFSTKALLSFNYTKILMPFLIVAYVFFNLDFSIKKDFQTYRDKILSFSEFYNYLVDVSQYKDIADNDSIYMLRTYFPNKEFINIGYHHRGNKYKKLSASEKDNKIFENEFLVFHSLRCKWDFTKSGVDLCSKENYLDYDILATKYSIVKSICYEVRCVTLLKQI